MDTRTRETVPIAVREVLADIGRLVGAARRERRMSQAELARRVGVGRGTIVRLEAGAPEVGVGSVLTAAWVLGLPLLRQSDFAAARPESAVAEFLARLDSHLPQRAMPVRSSEAFDDDF